MDKKAQCLKLLKALEDEGKIFHEITQDSQGWYIGDKPNW